MNLHANAALSLKGRRELGLRDRSSAPHRCPHRTSEQRVEAIAALRRVRFTGPEIAEVLDPGPECASSDASASSPRSATSATGPVS
jgi:hypothetical protein